MRPELKMKQEHPMREQQVIRELQVWLGFLSVAGAAGGGRSSHGGCSCRHRRAMDEPRARSPVAAGLGAHAVRIWATLS